eukprot:scaffold91744_cov78-Phaeocystis_antarctica.AAC.2
MLIDPLGSLRLCVVCGARARRAHAAHAPHTHAHRERRYTFGVCLPTVLAWRGCGWRRWRGRLSSVRAWAGLSCHPGGEGVQLHRSRRRCGRSYTLRVRSRLPVCACCTAQEERRGSGRQHSDTSQYSREITAELGQSHAGRCRLGLHAGAPDVGAPGRVRRRLVAGERWKS